MGLSGAVAIVDDGAASVGSFLRLYFAFAFALPHIHINTAVASQPVSQPFLFVRFVALFSSGSCSFVVWLL